MGELSPDDDDWGVPDALLPSQLHGWRDRFANTPEKRLWFAVLGSAVTALERGAKNRFEIWAWVASDDDRPCSFVFICDALDIRVDDLRPPLLEMASRPRGRPKRRRPLPDALDEPESVSRDDTIVALAAVSESDGGGWS